MIFTNHAIERYRQFHMLDRPTATDADASALLAEHGSAAVRIPARTHRGDEVWTIHALGVELVVKRDADFAEPVCVTVLPPARFRGLTPLQAERVEAAAREAKARADEAQREIASSKTALEEHKKATKVVERAVGPSRKAAVQQTLERERVELGFDIAAATRRYQSAVVERDIICAVLKTTRMQMHEEFAATNLRAALRAALRQARSIGATIVLEAVRQIDSRLASDAFIDGDGP